MANTDMKKLDINTNIDETLHSLRYKPVNSTTLERLRLCVEADKAVAGLPQPLQIGHGLGYILDNIDIPIAPHDLLIGRISEEVPGEDGERFFTDTIASMGTRPSWLTDGGHESFRWDIFLQKGFAGLEKSAMEALERYRSQYIQDGNENDKKSNKDAVAFLEGKVLIYQAHRNYIRRCAEAAKKLGLHEAAECLSAIADNPPKHFREALQAIWTLEFIYCTICALNPTLTLGRLDKLLIDFYRKDIRDGILDEESASKLITDFYCKNNIIMGRGEHQLSGGDAKDTGWDRNLCYDAPQYLTLGGLDTSEKCVDNELTLLFIKNIIPRFKNPFVVYRYCDQVDPAIWGVLCNKMAENSSMMIYNDHIIINSLISCGVKTEDAAEYEMYGCNWPSVSGNSMAPLTLHCPYVQYIRDVLKGMCEDGTADQLSQMDLSAQLDIDVFYKRLEEHAKNIISEAFDTCKSSVSDWPKHRPGVLKVDDCFMAGQGKEEMVTKAYTKDLGALDYTIFIMVSSYFGSAVDSITALDKLVFIDKKVSLRGLFTALEANFEGNEFLRQLCVNAPKFGQDDDLSNSHAKRLAEIHYRILKGLNTEGLRNTGIVVSSFETDTLNVTVGENTAATPDGRLEKAHLSQNASPAWGSCINGLTAMLMAAAKVPKDISASGALNVRINKDLLGSAAGRDVFPHIVKTYFDCGGQQIQCTITSAAELRAAQENPERYRDLMVRITGYSVSFVDMSKKSQDALIDREEMVV